MENIKSDITQLIGNTPLLQMNNIQKRHNLKARLVAKLEYFNPAGSAKDRAAAAMIARAEQDGLLKKGSVIIEPTSGNMGIGLAAVGASKGYSVVLTMPETMSIERIKLLKAYGAEIVLTDGTKGMQGAVEMANQLLGEIPNSCLMGQFYNPANPASHRATTGVEIWNDTDGKVDIFVAGIGTGGTISGVGEYLKSQNKGVKIVGVEPASSPLLTQGKAAAHKIQGIGANFIPENFNREICDEIIAVTDEQAFDTAKEIAVNEGILVGISSGAAVYAAMQLALKPENNGKIIVVLLPDTGERYLSTFVQV
ncbi:MAG: cysteine synthase A [Oscillospiraceae bacterium]